MSRCSTENLLSHTTEKLRRRTFPCSRKILVSKFVRDKSRGGGGGEYHKFPSNFFCLTVPKKFVGKTFSVSLISVIKNFFASELLWHDFRFSFVFFVSQCRNVS